MGRAKVKMELMHNEKARVKAFEKRKKGLEKSAHELSTLCGVDIGMIVYGPLGGTTREPSLWPREEPQTLSNLIQAYKLSASHDHYQYRTYNLSNFYKDQTDKINEELNKQRKKNRETEYLQLDETLNSLSEEELRNFSAKLTMKINAVKGRSNMMKASRIIPLVQQPGIVMSDPKFEDEELEFLTNLCKFEETNEVHLQPQLPYFYQDDSYPCKWLMMKNRNKGISSINDFIGRWF